MKIKQFVNNVLSLLILVMAPFVSKMIVEPVISVITETNYLDNFVGSLSIQNYMLIMLMFVSLLIILILNTRFKISKKRGY